MSSAGQSVPIDEAYEIAKRETIKGGVMGFTISVAASLLAHRFWPLYRAMSLPGKSMLVSMATAGYAGFRGEHSLYKSVRGYPLGSDTQPITKQRKAKDWPDWIEMHRLEITSGTVASALGASWLYFRHNADRTSSQKFMSIRLFTQGLVLCTVLGIVGLTALSRRNDDEDEVRKD